MNYTWIILPPFHFRWPFWKKKSHNIWSSLQPIKLMVNMWLLLLLIINTIAENEEFKEGNLIKEGRREKVSIGILEKKIVRYLDEKWTGDDWMVINGYKSCTKIVSYLLWVYSHFWKLVPQLKFLNMCVFFKRAI